MQEELIREYIKNGGEVWLIESIDTYRDGGTKVIITNIDDQRYYIHKNNFTLHNTYPTYVNDEESIVTDKPTIAYIMYRLNRYKETIEHKLKSTNFIIETLSIEGIRDRKINEILDK